MEEQQRGDRLGLVRCIGVLLYYSAAMVCHISLETSVLRRTCAKPSCHREGRTQGGTAGCSESLLSFVGRDELRSSIASSRRVLYQSVRRQNAIWLSVIGLNASGVGWYCTALALYPDGGCGLRYLQRGGGGEGWH